MAKKGDARANVSLKCTECKHINYRTPKNKKNTTERLELKKYCNNCQKTTVHKEEK
jgi:large subunit ribosomal protein L33